jgi:pimeloyl-ACP methyl ester carboxylesterase
LGREIARLFSQQVRNPKTNSYEKGIEMDTKSNITQRIVFAALIIILAQLLTGCGKTQGVPMPIPEGAQAGDLMDLEPCTYKKGKVEYTADCGQLIVPENRNNLDSRLISIPVTRIKSTGNNPMEPIFFLPGGPGISNSGTSLLKWFIENHDFVIVGYRGVDGSVQLDCPEISAHIKDLPGDMLGEASMENMTDAYARCAERLQSEGVDLAGYTVTEVIDDLEDARLDLGYGKINLFSISYGTRLAMIYAWRYPESIYRSAMVGANPPGHMFYYDPVVIDQQLAYYADLCAQDPKCSALTDDLAETMRTVSQNMPERWLGLPIDLGMIRAASLESLSDTQSASKVFDVWLAAARGDYSGMTMLTLAGPMMFANATVWGENMAKAASADYEATYQLRTEMDLANSIIGASRSEIAAAAAGWPVNSILEEYQQMQPSDVETLMVSGSIDLWTPAFLAEEIVLPYLSKGQHVVISESGHGEMLSSQPEASERLLTSFFDTSEADGSLFTYQPWEYDPGLGFPAIAKILVAAIILIPLGMVWVVWLVIRRVRNHRKLTP